jgi:crossover junction endodeoxyribonuclease RusA
VGRDKKGRVILVESSKKVKPWRDDVKAAALVAMGGPGKGITGPVKVQMIFTMPKPKSAPKRRKTWPSKYPDLSKLVRSTEDALTDIGAWEDDARVIELRGAKVFPGEDPRSLAVPGAVIRIESVEDI